MNIRHFNKFRELTSTEEVCKSNDQYNNEICIALITKRSHEIRLISIIKNY